MIVLFSFTSGETASTVSKSYWQTFPHCVPRPSELRQEVSARQYCWLLPAGSLHGSLTCIFTCRNTPVPIGFHGDLHPLLNHMFSGLGFFCIPRPDHSSHQPSFLLRFTWRLEAKKKKKSKSTSCGPERLHFLISPLFQSGNSSLLPIVACMRTQPLVMMLLTGSSPTQPSGPDWAFQRKKPKPKTVWADAYVYGRKRGCKKKKKIRIQKEKIDDSFSMSSCQCIVKYISSSLLSRALRRLSQA